MAERIDLVLAGPKQTETRLREIVESAGWQLHHSPEWRLALDLAVRLGATVFMFDYDANPSEWEDALGRVLNWSHAPAFLMTSRLADDRLWAELLARGGYDLLLTPFDDAEVQRTIRSAHQHCKESAMARPTPAIARAC